jgi:hypothetical protein
LAIDAKRRWWGAEVVVAPDLGFPNSKQASWREVARGKSRPRGARARGVASRRPRRARALWPASRRFRGVRPLWPTLVKKCEALRARPRMPWVPTARGPRPRMLLGEKPLRSTPRRLRGVRTLGATLLRRLRGARRSG